MYVALFVIYSCYAIYVLNGGADNFKSKIEQNSELTEYWEGRSRFKKEVILFFSCLLAYFFVIPIGMVFKTVKGVKNVFTR